MADSLPDPWLRGPIANVSPLVAPVLYAFEQAREDLARHTEGLTTAQVWARPYGLTPVGFHLRHIAGSAERLATYLAGGQLSAEQLAALETQLDPGEPGEELMRKLNEALDRVGARIRSIDPATLDEPRDVGRKKLPSTVIGIAFHIAEHAARHVGQAISAAKLARETSEK